MLVGWMTLGLGLTGCGNFLNLYRNIIDPDEGYSGYQIDDHFPLDGQRSWEYASDDHTVDYTLEVEMSEATTTNDGSTVREFTFFNMKSAAAVLTMGWSSDSSDGVRIHNIRTYADSSDTSRHDSGYDFADSPIIFAEPEMAPGDFVVSGPDGWTFTSTFEAVEPCHNHWTGEEWNECLRFHLDDDGANTPFAGDYWLVTRYGIAMMALDGEPDLWRLRLARWEAE